jgi:poly(3-hydroxybutyrate) depolymerase
MEQDGVVGTSYGPRTDGSEVTLYVIQDGGHAWPGGSEFDAKTVIWDFFARHE